ncbi:phage head closure protein [Aureimonas sp. AU40]|uniref:phage head closure protein n=1 Tax=Aureimonas sp. AU40 TaxID=1637747 RepID=UPI0007821B5C|nr:phage head closure protein [Aureimonas sp. AU40]
MALLFLDPGLLTKRAAIERNDLVTDGSGGARENWVEVGETSVRVEPLTAIVEEKLGQRIVAITHRVTLRARAGLVRGMAFRLGARRLLIRSLHDPDETGRWLVCRCEEEA